MTMIPLEWRESGAYTTECKTELILFCFFHGGLMDAFTGDVRSFALLAWGIAILLVAWASDRDASRQADKEANDV